MTVSVVADAGWFVMVGSSMQKAMVIRIIFFNIPHLFVNMNIINIYILFFFEKECYL